MRRSKLQITISSIIALGLISCATKNHDKYSEFSPKQRYQMGVRAAVDQDYTKAGALLKSAAESGFLPAQWDYAMFLYGMGPDDMLDAVESFVWFSVVENRDPASYPSASEYKKKIADGLSEHQHQTAVEKAQLYLNTE